MDFAYKNMGATILGGALTSVLSAIFLITCQTATLNKFGYLLLATIISSLLVSLIYFPAMIYIMGPENKQGDA